jgi:hypothetical protein
MSRLCYDASGFFVCNEFVAVGNDYLFSAASTSTKNELACFPSLVSPSPKIFSSYIAGERLEALR